MARKRGRSPAPGEGDGRWVYPFVVRHHLSGKLIRRRDGKRFKFWVKKRPPK